MRINGKKGNNLHYNRHLGALSWDKQHQEQSRILTTAINNVRYMYI